MLSPLHHRHDHKRVAATTLALLVCIVSLQASALEDVVRMEPPGWNFGARPQHYLITKSFQLGPADDARDSTVQIDRTWTSCECFSVQILKDASDRDGPAQLRVVMDTETYDGRFGRTIFVAVSFAPGGDATKIVKRDLILRVTGWVVPAPASGVVQIFYNKGTKSTQRFLDWHRSVSSQTNAPRVALLDLGDESSLAELARIAERAMIDRPTDELLAVFDGPVIVRGEKDVAAALTGFLNLDEDGEPDTSPRAEVGDTLARMPEGGLVRERTAIYRETSPGVLEIHVYYFSRCRGCGKALAAVRRLSETLGERCHLAVMDVDRDREMVPQVYAALEGYANVPKELPSMIALVGDRLLLGPEQILDGLDLLTGEQLAEGGQHLKVPRPEGETVAFAERAGAISVAVIVIAALADGVNPCAFAMMTLLISILSVAGLSGGDASPKRDLIFGGGALLAGVFLTYFAAGLALFGGAHLLASYSLLERIVFWIIWALAASGCALSAVDAVRYSRTGDAGKVLLKVPERLRARVAPLLRSSYGRAGLVAGGFGGGVVVALIEGACTGQMYLPTIQYMATTPGLRSSGMLYLLVYNALFVLPLAAILGVALAGVHFRVLGAFLREHLAAAKALMAVVFFALAAAMLVGRVV